MEKILRGEDNEYGLTYILDKGMDSIISDLAETGEGESSWRSNHESQYRGDIVNSSSYVTNLALMQDLQLSQWPRHSGEWEELKKMPKKSNWKNIQEVEKWAWETMDEIQEDFMSHETGIDYPREEDYEDPKEYEEAMAQFDEDESEIHEEWMGQSLKGGFAKDLLNDLNDLREQGLIPSAQELYEMQKKEQAQLAEESEKRMFSEIPTASSNNWYKKAQLEQSKVKYDKKNNGIYILSRNTKPDEGPWRISLLTLEEHSPLGHQSFLTYEEALKEFNYMPGIEASPDITEKEVYELV